MPRYTGINHLAMATGDMDGTVRLVAGLGHPGYRHYFFEISAHDMIAFFEWPGVAPLPEKDHGVPVKGPYGFDHFSFEVESDDDLWEIKDRLEAAEMWVSEMIDHGFIHSIYTFDPNHIAIEFSAPVAGVNVRERPAMRDSHPSAITLEGSEPQQGKWPSVMTPTPDEDKQIYPGEGTVFRKEDGRRP